MLLAVTVLAQLAVGSQVTMSSPQQWTQYCLLPAATLLTAPGDSVLHWLPVPGAGWLPRPQHGAARPRHQPVQGVRQAEQGDTGGSRAGNEVSQCPEKDPRAFSLLKAMKALSQIRHYAEHGM